MRPDTCGALPIGAHGGPSGGMENTTTPQSAEPSQAHERALATVETVTAVRDIPDAEFIVCARVRGWDVVVKRGEFAVGDRCVYFEVDSMLEVADDRFSFLAARGVRANVDGSYGHVLKTARLRGQYSQGLAIPLADFPELGDAEAGTDVTALVPVVKFEPPVPAQLTGVARGLRPSWIAATDEERIQNLPTILADGADLDWVATEKLDGTSTTYYVDPQQDGYRGVCSRNLDLLANDDNTLWKLGAKHQVHDLLEQTFPGRRAVVQGETYGEGIQGNPLRLHGQHFAAFNLIVDGAAVPAAQWPAWLTALAVPVHDLPFPATLEDALAQVENLKSQLAPQRAAEGLVWRGRDCSSLRLASGRVERASFKVISNRYLMKNDR